MTQLILGLLYFSRYLHKMGRANPMIVSSGDGDDGADSAGHNSLPATEVTRNGDYWSDPILVEEIMLRSVGTWTRWLISARLIL